VNLPIFDTDQLSEEELPHLSDEIRHKVQEFVAKGSIDDMHLLKVKTPLWEYLDTKGMRSKPIS